MLYAAEVGQGAAYVVAAYVEKACREGGGHGVVEIVEAVEREFGAGHVERRFGGVDHEFALVVDVSVGSRFLMLGEGVAGSLGGEVFELLCDNGVVLPVYEGVLGSHIVENAEFGVDVVLHLVVVAVEVVGGDVENHGHVGAETVHVFKLETRELDDVDVVGIAGHLQSKAFANVSGEPDVYAGVLKNMVCEKSGGGFAVRAGNANHFSVGVATGELNF